MCTNPFFYLVRAEVSRYKFPIRPSKVDVLT